MSPAEGGTCNDRDVSIDVVSQRVGRQWERLVRVALVHQSTWFYWLVVFTGPSGPGAYWFWDKPSPARVYSIKRRHGANAIVVDMRRLLGDHVAITADEAMAGDDPACWPCWD